MDLMVDALHSLCVVTPVQAIPNTLPQWRWAALTYFIYVSQWPFTIRCRALAHCAKEHVRRSVVRAIEAGEHHR